MHDFFMREFEQRRARAEALAERFRDLPTDDYETFLLASEDAGLFLDFVSSSMLFDAVRNRKAAQTPQ